jgi:hypothetical protein
VAAIRPYPGTPIDSRAGLNRALSMAWLLVGLALLMLSIIYLAASARLGWQSPTWTCANFLSRSCQRIGGLAIRDIKSATMTAAVGTIVLVTRCLAVRYAGLAALRRGFILALGLMLGLVAFGFGLFGTAPDLPGSVSGDLFVLLDVPLRRVPVLIGSVVLIECLGVVVSLADVPVGNPRPTA